MQIPKNNSRLDVEQIQFLQSTAKSCRRTIIQMLAEAQSGHTGGSLSCIDYLTLLYSFIVSQTGEKVVVSNGHISPAVYSILAELGYISKDEVINNFRKIGSMFEGHVTRMVPGIWFNTGPLATGLSAATGFALAEKINQTNQNVFTIMGDGELEEGQAYEALNFAAKYKLNNLVVFMDYNRVQLSGSLKEIMPIRPKKIFQAAGWNVIETDGHNFAKMWKAVSKARQAKKMPTIILAHTVMGKGVDFTERAGKKLNSAWHGKPPTKEEAEQALQQLKISDTEIFQIENFKKLIKWQPVKPQFKTPLSPENIYSGNPILYSPETVTDCRTAYGQALLDLAKNNPRIIAISADIADSTKTSYTRDALPKQHIEVGIAEQLMISCAGGLSLSGVIPFCSTLGAFLANRAKDQIRANDINDTNVKMVATHCGLSVGEDGPTHQAIDDMNTLAGLFNTQIIEPADPNHCDRIIRFIASKYGNFYVRMGRHKIQVLTKEDGSPFYGANYVYEYGTCDILRAGEDITVVVSGSLAAEVLKAYNLLKKNNPQLGVEIIIAPSLKKFDNNLINSIKKTRRVLTVEDHNTISGLGTAVTDLIVREKLSVSNFEKMGVTKYMTSGTAEALYEAAGLSATHIADKISRMIK